MFPHAPTKKGKMSFAPSDATGGGADHEVKVHTLQGTTVTYPTLAKRESSSKGPFGRGYELVPRMLF